MSKPVTSSASSVLVIDSGIGGLSICNAISSKSPALNIHYCLDNDYFPYGNKSEKFIQQRLIDLVEYFLPNKPSKAAPENIPQPDLIVVACNTASTTVLPFLRDKFNLPFVGVVPAIKPACKHSKSKHIVLLATSGTIHRRYTQDLIAQFANSCEVSLLGNDALVTLAEKKMSGAQIDHQELSGALGDLSTYQTADSVVLGCTHFPFLKHELQAHFAQGTYFIDSGEAIARRVHSLLPNSSSLHTGTKTAFFTAEHKQNSTSALHTHQFIISNTIIKPKTADYGYSA